MSSEYQCWEDIQGKYLRQLLEISGPFLEPPLPFLLWRCIQSPYDYRLLMQSCANRTVWSCWQSNILGDVWLERLIPEHGFLEAGKTRRAPLVVVSVGLMQVWMTVRGMKMGEAQALWGNYLFSAHARANESLTGISREECTLSMHKHQRIYGVTD